MSLEKQIKTVNSALKSMGIDPEMAKNEDEGQWTLFSSDKIELFIDVWPAAEQKHWSNYFGEQIRYAFQIIAPVVYAPEGDTSSFYADLMDMNLGFFGACLVAKKDEGLVCVKYRIAVEDITEAQVSEALDIVSYYAELMQVNLSKMYGVKGAVAGEGQ